MAEVRKLHIDIETYSNIDISDTGAFRYVDTPEFEILLVAYAFDDEEVRVVDLTAEEFPKELEAALFSPCVIKYAHNAAFEMTCFAKWFNREIDFSQWRCTMIMAAELGLPLSLKDVGTVLNFDKQKDTKGAMLIRYFCKPCKPTIANGGRTRNLPEHAEQSWELFKEYCMCDVEVERQIEKALSAYPMPQTEQKLWELDMRINARGVNIDSQLVENAVYFKDRAAQEMRDKLIGLTGLDNPNSVSQLKAWVNGQMDCEIESLAKSDVEKLIADNTTPEIVKQALILRQGLGKSSLAKYDKITQCLCSDSRIRGLTQFYGAAKTGRWAGRLVQLQNLAQNHLPTLDEARQLVKQSDYEWFTFLYNAPQVLSELIRTTLIPTEGRKFIVADFSAIEARVLSWVAGESWRQKVFSENGDIYCASASKMFGVPVVKHGENGHLRQKGKVAELACGYGGGVGALRAMGAERMGLTDNEMKNLITDWRGANRNIVDFWHLAEQSVRNAISNRGMRYDIAKGICVYCKGDFMFIELPSKRCIAYYKPRMAILGSGRTEIVFEGQNQTTRKWEVRKTYGGSLTENIVQAIARDCLAEAMIRLEAAGYEINFTVHDEVIIDSARAEEKNLQEVIDIMCAPIPWAEGLILNADGFISDYYKKD